MAEVNHHGLAIGGLGHALAGGHIDKATHDKGVASARAAMAKAKAAKAKVQETLKKAREATPAPSFGSLAPVPMPPKPPLEWNASAPKKAAPPKRKPPEARHFGSIAPHSQE